MILIIDFGSQFTQLLARRIRELGVYSEIIPFHHAIERIGQYQNGTCAQTCKGIIFSGGPHSVYDKSAPQLEIDIEKLNIPLLGVCYGLQLINKILGGQVSPAQKREYGFEQIQINKDVPSTTPMSTLSQKEEHTVWMSHGDEITTLAPSLRCDAKTRSGVIASFHHVSKPIFGVQFHPEVAHSPCGKDIIKQFVYQICHAEKDWDSVCQIETAVQKISDIANSQDKKSLVICALSGGVDSCVAAVLAQKALGDRLICLFVNNGLLRKNEYNSVLERFKKDLNLNIKGIDASEIFLSRLKGVAEPEEKRKIIGRTFIEIFEDFAKSLPNASFLVQGTLYPNVGGLPKDMKFKLIEPLRELFKDEVRALGRALHIPEDMLNRHPFPGPGLGIRVLGEVTAERLDILREADAIFVEELHKQNLYNTTWQAFVVLLPVQSVGVMGDGRTYENVAALRCVSAIDGMTADWSRLPYEFLAHVSSRIINEVRGINRVVYDISTKPPATIEWE
jgi:GMP synthase (glutamine-hydrolysing)